MIRKIVHIDSERCNGCGACADACHEGAIAMIDGKAKLLRDDYCDGLGDCLPACPVDAITIEEREAADYDERLVALHKQHLQRKAEAAASGSPSRGGRSDIAPAGTGPAARGESELAQWPCQIELVPVDAPFFDEADLLVAADCTAFAYAYVHHDFMRGRVTLIGCPKLDGVDYSEKLGAIIGANSIRSLTVLRMDVPCCGGLASVARKALEHCGKELPLEVVTISRDGRVLG